MARKLLITVLAVILAVEAWLTWRNLAPPAVMSVAETSLMTGSIEVVGVYNLRVSEELIRETTPITGSRDSAIWLLNTVVLIELVVAKPGKRFNVCDFVQPSQDTKRKNWQVAYDEVYLSIDGNARIDWNPDDNPSCERLRMAFWLHCYEAATPIMSSFGQVVCPRPRSMPDRLLRIVRYRPPD